MVAATTSTIGDPHCFGFRDQIYDFMGEPNKTYCFYSHKTIFANFHLSKWDESKTYISKIGLCVLKNKIEVGLAESGDSLYCLFNGKPVNKDDFIEILNFSTGVFDEKGNEIQGYAVCDENNKWCNVKCGLFDIQYWWSDELYENVTCPHLSQSTTVLDIGVLSQGVLPHGIIGCTARYDKDPDLLFGLDYQGRGIIEGHYTDYEVSGLFETDFKYNKFGAEPDTEALFGIGTNSQSISE